MISVLYRCGGCSVLVALFVSYDRLVESGAPAQISFGFGMGVCCGFAAKKVWQETLGCGIG